jgi:hypothetical protein
LTSSASHLVYCFLTTVPNAVGAPIRPKMTDEERDVWLRRTVTRPTYFQRYGAPDS